MRKKKLKHESIISRLIQSRHFLSRFFFDRSLSSHSVEEISFISNFLVLATSLNLDGLAYLDDFLSNNPLVDANNYNDFMSNIQESEQNYFNFSNSASENDQKVFDEGYKKGYEAGLSAIKKNYDEVKKEFTPLISDSLRNPEIGSVDQILQPCLTPQYDVLNVCLITTGLSSQIGLNIFKDTKEFRKIDINDMKDQPIICFILFCTTIRQQVTDISDAMDHYKVKDSIDLLKQKLGNQSLRIGIINVHTKDAIVALDTDLINIFHKTFNIREVKVFPILKVANNNNEECLVIPKTDQLDLMADIKNYCLI
jgi:hypothetical protein